MLLAERAMDRRALGWFIPISLLAIVVSVPSRIAGAQVNSCASTIEPVKPAGWLIDTRSAALIGEELMLFGQHPAQVTRSGGAFSVDTMMAGVVARRANAPRAIPLPRQEMRVHRASVARVSDVELRVVFRTEGSTPNASREPFTLWTGRLVHGAWVGVREVGVFHSPDSVEPEMASGIVGYNGDQLFAFAQDAADDSYVVVVRMNGDSVSTTILPVPFAGLNYPSLAVQDGRLWLSVTGVNPVRAGFADVWLAEVIDDSVRSFRPVVSGGQRFVDQPKLVPTGEGLLLAWLVEAGDGRTVLEWKAVLDPGATVNSRPARWPFARGAPPFEHLVAVPTPDSPTAEILQLLPAGVRKLASVESQTFYPAVFGWGDRLFAASVVKRVPGEIDAALGVFDLSCALDVARPPRATALPRRPR